MNKLNTADFHSRVASLFALFRDKDYFKQRTGLSVNTFPSSLRDEANVFLNFNPFPFEKWTNDQITENNLFALIEFLHDRISKPGEWVEMSTSSGYTYSDYATYDEVAGKTEFREAANAILFDCEPSYELSSRGEIETLGSGGLQYILGAEIVPFDEINVDSKVALAIAKWKNRKRTLDDMKESVRLLADVFEFLKKAKQLGIALDTSDASDLFKIANNFSIRHHNQQQKSNYDPFIWYSWMFHFYLATYHAAIRLIQKKSPAKPPI
jgi:hypothetical protein